MGIGVIIVIVTKIPVTIRTIADAITENEIGAEVSLQIIAVNETR